VRQLPDGGGERDCRWQASPAEVAAQELLTAAFERSRDASQPHKARAPFAEIGRLPEGRRFPDSHRDTAAFAAGLQRTQKAEEARAAVADEGPVVKDSP
jgi:hypothetical protein